jgi:hypothetical protein
MLLGGPEFVGKVHGMAGFRVHPPAQAIVLSV